jgi:aspartokinase/homoserine dehydrogenase 1
MDVVLANKRPLSGPATTAEALTTLAGRLGRQIRYEATVGAGLPVMDTIAKLRETGDEILSIEGCLSGTLGFVFTELERGRRFSQAVQTALDRGYTEPDPREDLSGADVARKALILGRLMGFGGEPSSVAVESLVPRAARALPVRTWLARLPAGDDEWAARVKAARAKGAVFRYLATVTPRRIKVGVTTLGSESPFAALRGTDNLIVFTSARYHDHPLLIRGPGAGPQVTAGGVLNDVLALARR